MFNSMYYIISFFIIGLFFGSFYHVVGLRIPRKESIVYPPSHCPKCKHKLEWFELIPILSYIFLLGKCRNCKQKIPVTYPFIELITGILFAYSYYVFGVSLNLLFTLILISGLLIIIVADFKYMIIPDEIIIILSIVLIVFKSFMVSFDMLLNSLGSGVIAFVFMFMVKYLGDKSFKRESLGGGDVKLMFILGFVFGIETSVMIVFISSLIAFPVAIFILIKKKSNILPFGPFLSMAAITLYLLQITMDDIMIFLFL